MRPVLGRAAPLEIDAEVDVELVFLVDGSDLGAELVRSLQPGLDSVAASLLQVSDEVIPEVVPALLLLVVLLVGRRASTEQGLLVGIVRAEKERRGDPHHAASL